VGPRESWLRGLPSTLFDRTPVERSKDAALLAPFPCYLFLRGGIERRLDLLTVYGVLGLVGTGGAPAAIEENEIEAIRRPTANAVQIEPHQYVSFGDWVRVTPGAFMGLDGIVIRKKNQYRLRLILSVEMLGRSASVELDGGNVERVMGTSSAALARQAMPPSQSKRHLDVLKKLPYLRLWKTEHQPGERWQESALVARFQTYSRQKVRADHLQAVASRLVAP
jgi:hypothetical protein